MIKTMLLNAATSHNSVGGGMQNYQSTIPQSFACKLYKNRRTCGERDNGDRTMTNVFGLGHTRDSKGRTANRHIKNIANTIHTSIGSGGNTDFYLIEIYE